MTVWGSSGVLNWQWDATMVSVRVDGIKDRCFQGWGMLMDRLTSTQQEQPHSIAAARESTRRLERDGFDVPTWGRPRSWFAT